VETETPVWHHCGLADYLGVLPSSLNRCGTRDEVQIDDTAESVVFQELAFGIIDLDIHTWHEISVIVKIAGVDLIASAVAVPRTIAIQQEHRMCSIVATVIVVDRVSSIEVGSFWNSIRIAVPQCACVVGCVEHASMAISTWSGRDCSLDQLTMSQSARPSRISSGCLEDSCGVSHIDLRKRSERQTCQREPLHSYV
jgi:hypothetical protein